MSQVKDSSEYEQASGHAGDHHRLPDKGTLAMRLQTRVDRVGLIKAEKSQGRSELGQEHDHRKHAPPLRSEPTSHDQ